MKQSTKNMLIAAAFLPVLVLLAAPFVIYLSKPESHGSSGGRQAPSSVSRTIPSPDEQKALQDATRYLEQAGGKLSQPAPQNLTEAERKAIYLDMSKAIEQAEFRGYANYDYRPEIARRHGLTVKQVNSIAIEGVKRNWPVE